ncbi:MAG: DUF2750 domain-containing protein [Saprospiraceae bacterium]
MQHREADILEKKPQGRYKYFVTETSRTEEVWALSDQEGWLILGEAGSAAQGVMPIFPGQSYAEAYRQSGGLDEYACETIDLNEFIEWLPDLQQKSIQVAVFPHPDPEQPCIVTNAEKLAKDFRVQFAKEKGE